MPRETLTRDQIVRAAIGLLDEAGLGGLSMRALGRRLGAAPTAMYWHVGGKEDLVVLAADHVWGEIAAPDPAGHGWRAAARALLHDAHAMFQRHPWLVSALSIHFVHGYGTARFRDHARAVHEAAGFTGGDLDRAVDTAFTFVAGTALLDAPRGRGEEDPPPVDAEMARRRFAFGVEALLDGLEARL